MSTVSRGVRGVFRNGIRTTGVTIILSLSVGLALVMLLALTTVQSRINSLKSSVGNTVTISPAGFSDFSSANNALSTSQLDKVAQIPHVTSVTETLTGRVTTIGAASFGFGGQSSSSSSSSSSNDTTSLTSPVKLQAGGGAGGGGGDGGGGGRLFINGGGNLPANFSLPISVLGTTDPTSVGGSTVTISSGKAISGTANVNEAMVSTDMASKNNLKVGSTFTAYGATLTVAGIYSSSTQGGGNNIVVSLPTAQRLTGQAGDVTSATANIDSVDNLSSATTAIKNQLGSTADVENSQQQANTIVSSLENIKSISLYSLIGALIAGAIITFLTMLMIVRERRREIGVLKAIGSSNFKIVLQFVSEAMTLTVFGAIIGTLAGILLANPILKVLVSSSTMSTTVTRTGGGGGFARGGGGGFAGAAGRSFGNFVGGGRQAIAALHASFGYDVLLFGLAAAFVIAIAGSAIPAWLIAKVRPAEVMRGE